ncbi:MAG: 2-phospho-L-lactate transferase [Acidimicrobiales bacterium]
MIVTLAGGVGAARFLKGLRLVKPPSELVAIVNTGDDTVLHGLHISPDLDTVMYSLAGADNPETGWGLAGETWQAMAALERLGGPTWFSLGDKDLATHLYRTGRLAEGGSLSQITQELCAGFGVEIILLPMSDQPVRTSVTLADSGQEVGFQEYFVALRHEVPIDGLRFEGAATSTPAPGVLAALAEASTIIIAPSNPLVSLGPLWSVPGLADAVKARRSNVVAVSPIVDGAALKGPAARMLTELGHEASVLGVAKLYKDLASVLVIDHADAHLANQVEATGMRCVVTDTIMSSPEVSAALASTVLECGS